MDKRKELAFVDALFDRLFPICRSITGPGFRESLDILAETVPFKVRGVRSGTKIFDWETPKEWRVREAWLKAPDGRLIADLKTSNLSVLNYSVPVKGRFSLAELQPHLHSIPSLPDAVPYVTSYYQPAWGFCLSQKVRDGLKEGAYEAFIDSELTDGEVNYGEAVLPGESTKKILISSYLCHPSLANNELSGPLTLALLYRRIACWKRRRYTYVFVVNPETIGSLAYLHENGDTLKKDLAAGLVLTCLGGPQASLSYKTTRRENALVDRLIRHIGDRGGRRIGIRPFTPTGGSDERQYCSPGFNLPVGQFARTVYGQYDGYHNSLDTKEFMRIERLPESTDEIENVLKLFEYAGRFRNLSPHGEPQLGKRGLYPNTNSPMTWTNSSDAAEDRREFLNSLLTILNYSDGATPMLDISERLDAPLERLIPVIDRLEAEGLLKFEPGDEA